ncbi:MAG: aminopeptidase P family N-terminal domain-containing protein, partial [Prevotella sp.]|nr:aminopeptidase P family N-terminal domain-containing protein [Prevotella sp.]
MPNTVYQRIAALRKFMENKGLHAFIVPSTDAHLSEYPAAHWLAREWLSGFTGSAGTVVVTRTDAALWTDSRYFLQAESELQGTEIRLCKEGLSGVPSIEQWLSERLEKGNNVGLDGNVYAAQEAFALIKKLNRAGLNVTAQYDPFDEIWRDRPPLPSGQVFVLPVEYAGVPASEKIRRLLVLLGKEGADALLVASLDTSAWIFNLRGNDVKCNPVAVAYAYISHRETVLFINPQKLNEETARYLKSEGVVLADYSRAGAYVASLHHVAICLSGNKISYALYNQIQPDCKIIDLIPSPADRMKSLKNEIEIKGFRNAMERDGAALVRFLMWLEKAVPSGNVSELTVVEKLSEYRSRQNLYVGESFDTIAGYGANGAIVHYHVSPATAATLKPEGFLLVDSG